MSSACSSSSSVGSIVREFLTTKDLPKGNTCTPVKMLGIAPSAGMSQTKTESLRDKVTLPVSSPHLKLRCTLHNGQSTITIESRSEQSHLQLVGSEGNVAYVSLAGNSQYFIELSEGITTLVGEPEHATIEAVSPNQKKRIYISVV